MSELKVGGKAAADKVNVLETRTVKEKHGIFLLGQWKGYLQNQVPPIKGSKLLKYEFI